MLLARTGAILLGCAVAAQPPVADVRGAFDHLQHSDGIARVAAARRLLEAGRAATGPLLDELATEAGTQAQYRRPKLRTQLGPVRARDPLERFVARPRSLLPQAWGMKASRFETHTMTRLADLRTDRFPQRQVVVWLLGEVGLGHDGVLDALEPWTASTDLDVRLQTIDALARLAKPGSRAMEILAAMLDDPLGGRRAGRRLAECGAAALPVLTRALSRAGEEGQYEAAYAIGSMPRNVARIASEALIAKFDAESEKVRQAAVWAVCQIGPTAVPGLLAALTGRNVRAREHAAGTLALLADDARAAADLLIDAVADHRHALVAQWAAQALGAMQLDGALADRRTTVLLAAARGAPRATRAAALEALGTIGETAAVGLLQRTAEHTDPLLALAAVRALGDLGADASIAVDTIAKAYRDTTLGAGLRLEALQTLLCFGAGALPTVLHLIAEVEPFELDDGAAPAPLDFSVVGTRAQDIAIETLRAGEPALREAAAVLLAHTSSTRAEVTRALIAALRDERIGVVREALGALRATARDHAAELGPAVALVLRSAHTALHRDALEMLTLLGEAGAAATESLIEALRSPDARVRARAARALGKIGTHAKAAIPALERAAADPVRYVGAHAATALTRIRAQ